MTKNKPKKKWYQKWWIWAIVVIVLILIFSGGNNDDASTKDDDVFDSNTNETITDTPDDSLTDVSNETIDDSADDKPLSFELVAGEKGEYGELFTINKGTEFEETYYIYRIPAGTYTVTNIGEYRTQYNVCCDGIIVNEDGWEEPSDIPYVKALLVGETDIFTIEDGQYIEIHEPTKLKFDPTNNTLSTTPQTEDTKETEEEVEMTTGQKNALRSAEAYLAFTAYSYNGLIAQLEFESYTTEESVFAADNCGADWNEQALKCAERYLNFTAFSYSGLYDQLIYEEFTTEQATYAVDNCGADWNEQAAKSATNYLNISAFSREGLIEQLEFEGFTYEQAVYGVEANGY